MDTRKIDGLERLCTHSYVALDTDGRTHKDELFSCLLLGSMEGMPRGWWDVYKDAPGLGLNHEGPHYDLDEDWDLDEDDDDFDLDGLEVPDFDEEDFAEEPYEEILLVPMHFFYN